MNIFKTAWNWLTRTKTGLAIENYAVALAENYIKAFFPALPLPTTEQWNALIDELGKITRGSEFVVVMEKFAELVLESKKP